MSDEVRSNSTPAPSVSGDTAAPPAEGAAAPASGFAPPSIEVAIPDPDGPGAELEAEPPTIPINPEQADASAQLLPQLSSELSPARHSERPPPPSQRKVAPARVGSVVATLRPGRETVAGDTDGTPAAGALGANDGFVPPPAPLGSSSASLPPPRHSEPVPLVTPKLSTTSMAPPRSSSLPPGLVEPKRIIEVLGSNVPVLDSALDEEEIEDLDETEAHELSDTPLPDPDAPASEPEIELSLDFDESESAQRAAEAKVESADAPSADATLGSPEPGADSSAARDSAPEIPSSDLALEDPAPAAARRPPKVPPNRRKRPPPPSSRASEKAKIETAQVGRKWWEEMFSEEFLRAIPILSPRQLEREVNFIDDSLGVAAGGKILDLACGAGQHAVELAARGYDVVGYDLSQSQLDWAGGLAQERGQRLQFTHGDMREMTFSERFDAIYSWNTSFGFFEEDKNVDIAQRVFRALRPGGRFLLDVVNRDYVVAQQPGQTWFEGDGCVCIDDVSIDFITSRMKVKRTLMLTTGKNRECNYSVRLYGLHELGKMLHDVGFKVLTVSGRPEMPGVFFGSTSPRIIILAAKP